MTPDQKIAVQCTMAYNCASNAHQELIGDHRRADELLVAIQIIQRPGNQAVARREAASTPSPAT